jgi:murein DD-endopeptidase MepM/ murein hydrolase activator NlpD
LSTGSKRRSTLAIGVAALTLFTLTVGSGLAKVNHAEAATTAMVRIEVSATALKPALRLSQFGAIMFPINPSPRCGMSKTSFGQPRSSGRTHEGLDIMADLAQEIYAVDNGVLSKQTVDGAANATLSGNAWTLKLPDGTYYYYGHLSAFAAGLVVGSAVTRGQLIGYVGDTGNANDLGPGNYHLHFEVHPKGGAAVNPFPLLTIPKVCSIWA